MLDGCAEARNSACCLRGPAPRNFFYPLLTYTFGYDLISYTGWHGRACCRVVGHKSPNRPHRRPSRCRLQMPFRVGSTATSTDSPVACGPCLGSRRGAPASPERNGANVVGCSALGVCRPQVILRASIRNCSVAENPSRCTVGQRALLGSWRAVEQGRSRDQTQTLRRKR